VADVVAPYQVSYDNLAGIVRCGWVAGSTCGLAEAVAVSDEVTDVAGGQRRPLLVDMRDIAGITREAREYFANSSASVTAIALLTGSAVTRMMANFFIGLRKTQAPMRMFKSEPDAVAWLTSLR
jgi:hypothetical protein